MNKRINNLVTTEKLRFNAYLRGLHTDGCRFYRQDNPRKPACPAHLFLMVNGISPTIKSAWRDNLRKFALKKIFSALTNLKGLTLTELIVASVLIGVVTAGVMSFGYAIRQIQDSTGQDSAVSLQTTTAFLQLMKDGNLSVGDNVGRGIYSPGSGAICFRHDTGNTPTNYTDDLWACYTTTGAAGDNKLYRCADLASPTNDCRGVMINPEFLMQVADTTGLNITLPSDNPIIPNYFTHIPSITINSAFTNGLAPAYSLSGSIDPPGQSR